MPSSPGAAQMSTYNRNVVAFAALGSMTYGYGASIISSTIGQPGWYTFFDLPPTGEPGYDEVTTPTIATANGLLSTGAAAACLAVMWTGDRFGRVRNLQAASLLGVLGGALQGAPRTSPCSRPADGEPAPPWLAGRPPRHLPRLRLHAGLVGRLRRLLRVGPRIVRLALPALRPGRASAGTVGRHAVAAAVAALAGLQEPARRGWTELQRLRQYPDDPGDAVAREELRQIQDQIALDRQKLMAWGGNPWRAVLLKRSYRKRMVIGFLTQWGAEFGGPLIINNYAVILYEGLGQKGSMPLLLSALWITTAALIYNPGGAWLHDKVNSRRWMFMTGFIGIIVTTSCLAAMIACFAGTDNRAGNAMGVFFIFLYLVFQSTFCDTTMYIYISEIFPTEIRSIGMGFSLFGQFTATIILLQTAPIGFTAAGWKYFLLVICWSVVFVPIIYFFFPETSQLSLEEVEKQFGDEVVTHIPRERDDKV
ncbi:mfs sugar transporter [Apiospora phragmitis]|uniref:Mfs sugar transporter n=1 Tax=Apiospora phragmitis TaxID=2905665 RepID=A0ABR1TWI3_9PEZI